MTKEEFLGSLRTGARIEFGESSLSGTGEVIGQCLARSLEAIVPAGETIDYAIEIGRPAAGWRSGAQIWLLALSRDLVKVVAELQSPPDQTATLHVSAETYPVRTLTWADVKTQHIDPRGGAPMLGGAMLSIGFARGTVEVASSRDISPSILVRFMAAVLAGNR
jgi:hypothetical protein